MTTNPKIGLGAQYFVETAAGSNTFTKLAKIMDLTPPNPSVDEHDVTNMDSTAKENISGLADYGETQVPMLYDETSDTDAFIRAWLATREVRKNRIQYSSGEVDEWSGWPKGYQPQIPVNGVCQATLTVRNTGSPARL